jgi:hypothetical protein
MDVINLTKTKLFHFYIIPISNFDGPMFYNFTKFLQHSNDVLPLSWCLDLVELKKFLSYKITR